MTKPKLLLSLLDYQRIFRMIYTVLEDRATTHRACIFFALVGAAILRQHYKLNAFPIAGAAAFAVNADDSFVATFGRVEKGDLICATDAFHCWVDCDGFAIDFMAPIFQESFRASGHNATIARRMFQRRLTLMAPNLEELTHEGAFLLRPDAEHTKSVIGDFSTKHANTDLANICLYWYKRPPKRVAETLDMQDDLGNVTRLKLHGPEITGVW